MKPAPFAYLKPANLGEALSLTAANRDDCKILAGGQSLVPAMNFRLARPGVIIDINEVSELAYVSPDGDGLRIGALTRHAAFHRAVADNALGRMLSNVVKHIAHYPIRQRGTFAGSLAHADPASEWCLTVTTLNADIVMRSERGERVVPAADFFRGTFVTVLEPDELIVEIRLPPLDALWKTGFYEFSRRAGDFALAMSLAALRIDNGRIIAARLGIGGVADRALRMTALEERLTGQTVSDSLFEAVGAAAREAIDPVEDIHASSEYRRDLIATVVRRALARAAA